MLYNYKLDENISKTLLEYVNSAVYVYSYMIGCFEDALLSPAPTDI